MRKATHIPVLAGTENKAGTVAEVALRVGVSADYVRKVLGGSRQNPKVERALNLLLNERERAKQKFQSEEKGA